MSKTVHFDCVVLNCKSQDMADWTEYWKLFFVEEEGSPTGVGLARQDTWIGNVRFGFPISSFMMSKSNLHCEEIAFSTSRILNNPQTDILITESLVFLCKYIYIVVVVVIRVVWVSPGLWILVDRIIIFNLIRALVSTILAVILVRLLATSSIALCCVN
jgi:hypothetical protein